MTRPRVGGRLACGLIVGAFLLACGAGTAIAKSEASWCRVKAPPCVLNATLNGAPLTPTDPNIDVVLAPFTDRGSQEFLFDIESTTNGADLGSALAGATFSVVIDTGQMVPRVAAGQANVSFRRNQLSDGTYQVVITGTPAKFNDNNNCNFSGPLPTCPFQATKTYAAFFQVDVGDYNINTYPPSWVPSFYGMDLSTNIAETGLPPQIMTDLSNNEELVLQLADYHEYADSTLTSGFVHLRIPAAFLQAVYGIDDPTTVTGSALQASIGAGTVTITPEAGNQALDVNVTGITFSSQTLVIKRGVITPGAPTGLHARRTGKHQGRISFQPAQAKGSAITGYYVSCQPRARHHYLVTAYGGHSPIIVRGLAKRVAYRCAVDASSRAGTGPTATVKLAR